MKRLYVFILLVFTMLATGFVLAEEAAPVVAAEKLSLWQTVVSGVLITIGGVLITWIVARIEALFQKISAWLQARASWLFTEERMKIINDAVLTFTAKAKQEGVDSWKELCAAGKIEKPELADKLSKMKAAVVAEIMAYLANLGIRLPQLEVESRVEAMVGKLKTSP